MRHTYLGPFIYLTTYLSVTCQHPINPKLDNLDLINELKTISVKMGFKCHVLLNYDLPSKMDVS